MQQLKIKKDLWDLILKGSKKYEFRKLSKGYDTGTYEFVDIDDFGNLPYGTAKIKPIAVNPPVLFIRNCQNKLCDEHDGICHCDKPNFKEGGYVVVDSDVLATYNESHDDEEFLQEMWEQLINWNIDIETYKFVKDNYIKQNIDFVVYEISNAEEVKHDNK